MTNSPNTYSYHNQIYPRNESVVRLHHFLSAIIRPKQGHGWTTRIPVSLEIVGVAYYSHGINPNYAFIAVRDLSAIDYASRRSPVFYRLFSTTRSHLFAAPPFFAPGVPLISPRQKGVNPMESNAFLVHFSWENCL